MSEHLYLSAGSRPPATNRDAHGGAWGCGLQVLGKLIDPNLGLENARLRQQLVATSQAGLESLAVLVRVEPSPVGLGKI